ncbi:MAG: chorismate synthase [Cytophagaceae bacterium]|jgi:chorismate synthase|nr:chorismate synthase [Cytophagaceae bacterium]
MAGNSFGTLYRLTSFGESHGNGVGGIIDGALPGMMLDLDFIQHELNRRRPCQSKITTPRNENDEVEFISGIFEGKTTGTPLAFVVRNNDRQSNDYNDLKDVFRPSHADYTYMMKYGIRDHRGGGRASARETIARVVAGAVAKQMLIQTGITVQAYTSAIGAVVLQKQRSELNLQAVENSIVRCPDSETSEKMIQYIEKIKAENDSVGGIVSCVIKNVPVGLGEPVFDRLNALLAHAMMSISAAKGFEYGGGFGSAQMKGSQHNDEFYFDNGTVRTRTNHSGGIQGGISNSEDIYFNVAFKPVATIAQSQRTVNQQGETVEIKAKGRHDPCAVPRAVPIVEAMAAMVIADAMLLNGNYFRV